MHMIAFTFLISLELYWFHVIALENIVQTQAITMARIDENIKSIREMMEDARRNN